MSNKIVVTKHRAVFDYLVKVGMVDPDTPHMRKVFEEDIEGKHVYGLLPNWLACHAEKITEVQLNLPRELREASRNREITLEEVEFYLIKPRTFVVAEIEETK